MKDLVNCKDCVSLLMDYLDDSLDADTKKELDEHFSACPPCLNFFDTYKTSTQMFSQLQERNIPVPDDLEERLKSFLRERL